ncbi:alpha/beta fold hydrolase [Bacillus sp. FJAT-49736]|uniref:S9 family peptidase n=1 Tax=Bacillus sp. FJAT-49736 TaxID=2833582 RepID=UPI001BCA4391|nr:alpha/beta fold hydrolase [Bacillus sp. FJAT-49736]MBS4174104.1 S9 family peptidase [Bacillus sp. FJAT-49736]
MITSKRVSLEQFMKPFSISAFSVSQDESYIVYGTNTTGSFNLWKMDLKNTEIKQQLSSHNQFIESIAVGNDSNIYFTSDKDGNENMHIYSIDDNGENWKDICVEQDCRYFFGAFSEDGSKLYYTSTKDNPIHLSIFSYDLHANKEELLHIGYGAETHLMGVSPNGKDIAYFIRYNHSNMKICLKKADQEIELIPNAEQTYRVSDLCFLTEDRILFTTNYNEEFNYLASYDVSTGLFEKVLYIDKQDIEKIQYFTSENQIYLQSRSGPIDRLYVYNMDDKSLVDLKAPMDTIQQFAIGGSGKVYTAGSSSTKPITLYRMNTDRDWEELIKNQVPFVPEDDLVKPERIQYKSFDGLEIEGMFYQAKQGKWNGHTIIYPHGGPQYNEQIYYDGFFQFLIYNGFHIFAPNFRGTPNYGTSFLKMIEGDWGGGPRLDVLSGIEALAQLGKIDSEKLILFGASYGGFLSLLLFGRHQDKFKACIDMCGPVNLFTFIKCCPEHWKERMDSWIGNPVENRERLIEQSPITYVENMLKPMLIIQGANDPRVKKSESDQMVEALKKNGVFVKYVVFDDEGHGFSKKENEMLAYNCICDFLMRIIVE